MSQLGRIPQGKNDVFHTVNVDQMNIVGTGGITSIGQIDIDSRQAAADAVRINASNAAGGIDVDAGTGGVDVDSTGVIDLNSSAALGADLNLTASSAAGAITLNAGTGGTGSITLTSGNQGITFSTTGQTQLDGATFQSAAIAGVTVVASAQSGTWFTVAQTSAYAITLPTPPTAGLYYKFAVITAGAFNVTVSNGSAHLFGTIVNDVTSVLPATGTTLTFASGATAVGDSVEIYGLDATHYFVKAVSSAAGGITIA